MSVTKLDIAKRLAEFAELPDDAIIPEPVAAALLGMSTDTYRRASPLPRHRIAKRLVGIRAGDLRALVRAHDDRAQGPAHHDAQEPLKTNNISAA